MEEVKHRGKFLEQKMLEVHVGHEELSTRMNIGRTTLWRWINNPNLDIDKLKRAISFLGLDWEKLNTTDSKTESNSTEIEAKLYKLQEKYIGVMEELAEYKAKYGELPGQ